MRVSRMYYAVSEIIKNGCAGCVHYPKWGGQGEGCPQVMRYKCGLYNTICIRKTPEARADYVAAKARIRLGLG